MYGTVFTIVVAFGGALCALQRPFVGFMAYVCLGLICPEDLWAHALPPFNYSRLVGVAMILGWALNGFGNWQFGRARRIVVLAMAFWGWQFVSAAMAPNQEVAWKFVESQSKTFLPFLIGITTLDSPRRLKQLVWVIVLTQGFLAFEMNVSYYQGFNRVQELGFRGMDNNCVAISMTTTIGLAIFLVLDSARWWEKAAAFGACLLMVHVILMSFSRGGMIGLIVTGATAFVLVPRRPAHYAVLIVIVLLGLRLAGEDIQKRFLSSFASADQRDRSAQSRIELWGNCLECMAANPVLGIGPHHWHLISHQYGWNSGKEAHTLWLTVGAELGTVGLALLVAFYGVCVVRLVRLTRRREPLDPEYLSLARMVIAAIIGFAVSAQFVSLIGLELPYYVVLVGCGVLKFTTPSAARPDDAALRVSAPAWAYRPSTPAAAS